MVGRERGREEEVLARKKVFLGLGVRLYGQVVSYLIVGFPG